MTLPDDLVKAASGGECLYPDPASPCWVRGRRHPECVLAAVLRALPESEAVVNVGANALSPGRWSYEDVPQHRDEMTHAILDAIAKFG